MITARVFPEVSVPGKPLGRHVWHDDRSRDYAVQETAAPLKSQLWPRRAPIFDQGQVGSCTGNAMAGWVGTDGDGRAGNPTMREADAVRLYSAATRLDSIRGVYPPDDTGSSGLAVAKAAKHLGEIQSYKHAFGLKAALAALQVGPVITGVGWTSGFDSPDSSGLVHVTSDVRGGHEFLVRGIDVDRKLVWADNSWGHGWGVNGGFQFSWADWDALLHQQGDVTVPVR